MIEKDTDIQTVEKIISKIGELPAAPVILSKALKLTSNLDSNIEDISKNISADQSLTAKVIKLSNSPIYGRVQRIKSLSESIKVLGFNQVKSIIVSASTYKVFKSGVHEKIADLLWQHSLATGLGARLLAKRYGNVDKEEAYLCGLLHDIGKLVLLQTAPHVYEEVITKVKETGESFFKVENRILGFNHANVGNALLTKWNFPPNLVREIFNQHKTKIDVRENEVTIARITAIANSMANYIGASFFEAFTHSHEDIIFIGKTEIEIEDYIALRLELEENFHSELNNFFD